MIGPHMNGPLECFPPPLIPGVLRLTFHDCSCFVVDVEVVSQGLIVLGLYSRRLGRQWADCIYAGTKHRFFAPTSLSAQCSIDDTITGVLYALGIAWKR